MASDEKSERPDLQAFPGVAVPAEEAGQHADQEERQQGANQRVEDGDLYAACCQVGGERHPEDGEVSLDGGTPAEAPATPTRMGVPTAPKLTGVL